MIDVTGRLARAVDAAVLWRLGLISVAPAATAAMARTDAAAFWGASRVGAPAPLEARPLPPAPRAAALRRQHPLPAGTRRLELIGASRGPGEHWGADHLRSRVALHPDPAAPFVLLLHGYAVPAPWWEEAQMQQLLRAGISAGRLELPFHLGRRLAGRPPGAGFFSSDPGHTAAVLRQSVEDAAAVVAWARGELGVPVGVLGVSLGGLVGALLATTVELGAAALVTPACDLVEIMLELAPMRLRRRLQVLGGGGGPWGADAAAARAALTELLAPVLPHTLRPRTSAERIVTVVADQDRIVGVETVRRLAAAWGVECWSYHRGHITVLTARGLNARLRARLAGDLAAARRDVATLAG